MDSAVAFAKEITEVILLEKSPPVLREGIMGGRKIFLNILQYIRLSASSAFGKMFSVFGADHFLSMAPLQILINILLYDFTKYLWPWMMWIRSRSPSPSLSPWGKSPASS